MATNCNTAPGRPGVAPHWAPSAKDAVGTALSADSPLWFTIHSGIITETFFPSIDRAAIRDFGLLVSNGRDFFSEEKTDTKHEIQPLAAGVPGWTLTNMCKDNRYRIVKTVIADPRLPTLLVRIRFEPLMGELSDYHLYALLAPHLGDAGADNSGHSTEQGDVPALVAQGGGCALALCSSQPFTARSCGYVGVSDGWQDVHAHCKLTSRYDRADNGNIALTGEIDPAPCKGEFVLAVGFGRSAGEALERAVSGIRHDFDRLAEDYRDGWNDFQKRLKHLSGPKHGDFGRMSAAVLQTHDSKERTGGIIASLSIPWGEARGDETVGGYHVIWPRDQVEGALALLAAGDVEAPRQSLRYLQNTQQEDGHWYQNMWVSGKAYWNGLQLDETALPILLADNLRRHDALGEIEPYPMIHKAADFLIANGPCSPMDRWEENAGYSTFTLATIIAALLAAAEFADKAGDARLADRWRSSADSWYDRIDRWTYVQDTDLAKEHGVEGYYIRIAPPNVDADGGPAHAQINLKNQSGNSAYPAWQIVSPDFLALVRYGLRKPDDPRIVNTVKVVDATLKTDTDTGPVWRRYTHDGYGQKADGAPFDGSGVGGGWPILTGERAHYELARGRRDEADRLLEVLTRQTSAGGMLPEQIWYLPDLPEHGLVNGKPSGSAMPLVWSHAEALKLIRSLHDNRVWDMPPQTVKRYLKGA